ncbi:MAG: thioredoxin family protein [Oscillospiraceae bacterium]
MSLFEKKKEKKKVPVCSCKSACPTSDICADEITNNRYPEAKSGVCCIKVLGAGCPSCHTFYENTKDAVKNIGLDIEIEYITDMQKVMEYGVMSVPALVVNDKVVSMGKALKSAAVIKLLQKLGF